MFLSKDRYFIYTAHCENGEWTRRQSLDIDEVVAKLDTQPTAAPHIFSVAWREGSYLSVRHNIDGSIQMICRARIGQVLVCGQPLDRDIAVQTVANFAAQKKDWETPLKWRTAKATDHIWSVRFYRFFRPRFWSLYATVFAVLGVGILIPTSLRDGVFLAFVLVAFTGSTVFSATIGAKVWIHGLSLIGWILTAKIRLLPVPQPPSSARPLRADYSLALDGPQPPWKRPVTFGLLLANAFAAFLVFMGVLRLVFNGVEILASWLGVPFVTK